MHMLQPRSAIRCLSELVMCSLERTTSNQPRLFLVRFRLLQNGNHSFQVGVIRSRSRPGRCRLESSRVRVVVVWSCPESINTIPDDSARRRLQMTPNDLDDSRRLRTTPIRTASDDYDFDSGRLWTTSDDSRRLQTTSDGSKQHRPGRLRLRLLKTLDDSG